ncbi:DUF4097 family beta strand repeat-containing protein [Cellulomonas gilvus]|uniref:DUF4097 domain-containing protein n=1 Tax=Cellulomonas gilvus (strain ATCC 13127 / NRRL B-14078) TaxID=593907 RepID=F8A1F5_CELGA|nr:DUF4097 family beta strand repeat-containing protein [Cellulomonas gilvus]AEI12839.1 hypothetical protein Celgi_2339 [Cellulomonas gilvus ATCC 13127]
MATESWVVAGPQIIEVERVDRLRVQLVGGRVDVVAHDEPVARIEVHSVDGRPLEIGLSDGELRVGYSFTLSGWDGFVERFRNFMDKDRADVHIAIPRSAAAKLGTVSADGLLVGVAEDSSVSTVSGSLVTDGTRGRLSVNTVNGEVVVRDHGGSLKANSVSGEVAASGELSLVQANTVSGALSLDVTTGTSSITASTVSGDVTVRLPAGRGVHVKAQSVSGRLVVDGEEFKGSSPGGRKVDMSTGDGACYVSANTVSGHVTVLRGVPDEVKR